MAADQPLEQRIADIVAAAVADALDPFLRRLGDPEPLVYSIAQAATVLGTSAHTIRRLVTDGVLPLVPHMGERRLIPRRAVHELVDGATPIADVISIGCVR